MIQIEEEGYPVYSGIILQGPCTRHSEGALATEEST